MDDKIRIILQQEMKEYQIYDLVDQLDHFVNTTQEYELLDSDDIILDHYNIPKDTWVAELEPEDQADDVFSRDFFHYRIHDTAQGDMTFEELDYFLLNWNLINDEICNIYPNKDGGGWLLPENKEVIDVIREAMIILKTKT